jgi:hypothetical protein
MELAGRRQLHSFCAKRGENINQQYIFPLVVYSLNLLYAKVIKKPIADDFTWRWHKRNVCRIGRYWTRTSDPLIKNQLLYRLS